MIQVKSVVTQFACQLPLSTRSAFIRRAKCEIAYFHWLSVTSEWLEVGRTKMKINTARTVTKSICKTCSYVIQGTSVAEFSTSVKDFALRQIIRRMTRNWVIFTVTGSERQNFPYTSSGSWISLHISNLDVCHSNILCYWRLLTGSDYFRRTVESRRNLSSMFSGRQPIRTWVIDPSRPDLNSASGTHPAIEGEFILKDTEQSGPVPVNHSGIAWTPTKVTC